MQVKFHIKKGDSVKVIAGNERGTKGKVLAIYPELSRALVEGVNIVSKHTKPKTANPKGGIVKKEASVHISNLMVVDSKGIATRIGRRRDDKGKLVRFSKKTGEVIK